MRLVRHLLLLLLALLPALTLATEFTARVVGVTDGDTMTVLADRRQVKVRLAEIDAPEKAQPWGTRARQALAAKVFRQDVRIVFAGMDRYGRTIGRVWLRDRDINRELVAEGHAWVYREYLDDRSLLDDEARAKATRVGLWGLSDAEIVAPWEWRRGGRAPAGTDPATPAAPTGSCGSKRYCREMASCEEARFYLTQCGLTRLDGDSDGVPCEGLCR